MNGKFALITGGSRGLGEVFVRRFWIEGYNICAVSRSRSAVERVLNALPKRANQIAVPLQCELGCSSEVAGLIERVKLLSTKLDVLINNAALLGPVGQVEVNDLTDWHRTIQVNLLAPVALCRGLIELLAHGKGGAIINLSGGGATGPRANFSAYATAKAGLVRFSETLAEELKPRLVRVNSIAPGAMRTSMLEEILAKGVEAGGKELFLARKVVDGEGACMERVADLALFLAGDNGRGITGKLISAVWDNWHLWPERLVELSESDAYTLRRVTGRDRGFDWGDK
jgi:NAD(P)-dependent dehydrogenase (short-subunit alcohol dehydrogenase family)